MRGDMKEKSLFLCIFAMNHERGRERERERENERERVRERQIEEVGTHTYSSGKMEQGHNSWEIMFGRTC